MWQCSQQHDNREEAKFCAKCGEKRVERVICSACNAVMEPDDAFCVACGRKRGVTTAPQKIESLPLPPPAVIPEVGPVVVAEPPLPSPEPPAVPPAAAEESFSFSFGGTTIGAQTPIKKTKKAKGPMATGMLSFVAFGVLLLIALYLLSR